MQERMRRLLEAGIALTSELSLDSLLQSLVETAADLTGARYAALGVIEPSRRELERFVTTGIDAETHAAIGDLPRGGGILGVLIRDAEALRLHDIADDPRSVGFPPNHPPMRTFLGVPILLRGVAYGNLYLTEKEGGEDFTTDDQEVATLLAAQAAVAIENARLFQSAKRWSDQLEALIEVGNNLATEVDPAKTLDLVARRLQEIVQARFVVVVLARPDGAQRVEAVSGELDPKAVERLRTEQDPKIAKVLDRRRSERVDSSIEDPEADRGLARSLGVLTALYAPMIVGGEAIGVILAADKLVPDRRFSHEDFRLAETFASRAAVAVDQGRRIQRDVFRRVVEAQEEERRRLARELHDETGQALTSILLGLKTLEETEAGDLETAVAALRERVVETLHDVRRLAVELRPKALDDFGLEPALERLTSGFAEQTGIEVQLQSQLGERLPGDVETVLYRIVQEALTNVVKHARAAHVSILLTRKNGRVAALIEDDGRGFDPETAGNGGVGLLGMRERIALLEGRLSIESREGAGTTIRVEVPLT
ncbi:MAG TPA: GAF domain-containing sensor histidine kinase [Gaiellaceae bacterium]|nr:GAF domain-containing sensor histidine kinase [Gaiellaceae bacterium]